MAPLAKRNATVALQIVRSLEQNYGKAQTAAAKGTNTKPNTPGAVIIGQFWGWLYHGPCSCFCCRSRHTATCRFSHGSDDKDRSTRRFRAANGSAAASIRQRRRARGQCQQRRDQAAGDAGEHARDHAAGDRQYTRVAAAGFKRQYGAWSAQSSAKVERDHAPLLPPDARRVGRLARGWLRPGCRTMPGRISGAQDRANRGPSRRRPH